MESKILSYVISFFFILIILSLILIRNIILKKGETGKIEIGNAQTIGGREEQDDYFATCETKNGTMAVLADGISGLANGRMASMVAVTTFIEAFRAVGNFANSQAFFKEAAVKSNQQIVQNLNGSNGGTTLVAVIIDEEGFLHWGAVGDSVITIFRKREFLAINEKHVFENVLKQRYIAGEISQLAMEENPLKKRLINYLGYEGFKHLDVGTKPIQLFQGDKVCLFSDGIYDALTEVELESLLSQQAAPYDIAQNIIRVIEKKQLKNQDNATIVILEKV